MTEPITIIIPGKPVPKARPRFTWNGKRVYTPVKTVLYERLVGLKANQAMAGKSKMSGPLHMDLRAHFEIPKSWTQEQRRKALLGEIVPGRIDVDNVVKSIADGCNKIVYEDDCQIVSISASKRYSHKAFVVATIKPVSHRVPETHDGARDGSPRY